MDYEWVEWSETVCFTLDEVNFLAEETAKEWFYFEEKSEAELNPQKKEMWAKMRDRHLDLRIKLAIAGNALTEFEHPRSHYYNHTSVVAKQGYREAGIPMTRNLLTTALNVVIKAKPKTPYLFEKIYRAIYTDELSADEMKKSLAWAKRRYLESPVVEPYRSPFTGKLV